MTLMSEITHIACELLHKGLESGVQSLHREVKHFFFWYSLLAFSMALLLGGLGFVMWGAYALLARTTGPGFAALIIGTVASLAAAVLVSEIKHSIK